ncbi:MAG: DUF389 domain-containing protein [Gemmatimonadetes bacterium]|nr:DUF389 domain-containing protein [Gemmatimonadota bacterium]
MRVPRILRLLDLRRDQRAPEAIHEAIEAGVQVAGTNLWVLIFAIFVASVGLNVNSTAVIIGAMLISPLMGPIVAIGYGAGVRDFALIRRALRTLGLFVAISLTTATVYFAVSPLSQAQSELLARTSPTLWDVLIAFFGGAAGIVALTRREVSNVVPGVAIATALMPPLCTAGYGIASRNPAYFGGAFYLFSINAVFIAFATLSVVKVLRLPPRGELDARVRRRARLIIAAAVTATLVPSTYLAYRLVQQEFFAAAAGDLVRELSADPRIVLLASEIRTSDRTLALTLGGAAPAPGFGEQLAARLSGPKSGAATVSVRHIGGDQLDVASLRRDLQRDLFQRTNEDLSSQLQALQVRFAEQQNAQAARGRLLTELRAEFPEAESVVVAVGEARRSVDSIAEPVLLVHMVLMRAVPASEERRLRARLAARFAPQRVEVLLTRRR